MFIDLQPSFCAIQAGKFANTIEEAAVRIAGMVDKKGLNGFSVFAGKVQIMIRFLFKRRNDDSMRVTHTLDTGTESY